jgi:MFS family permease
LPVFLFGLPAGALVDRVDRRRLMLVCDGVRAISVASIALALLEGSLAFAQIVVVAFVEGTMTVLADPAERGALRQIVPREDIPTAIAQNEARVYGASLAGPPLGGFLFGAARFAPFLFDAFSYVCSFATLAAISTPFQEERGPAHTRLRHEVVEGLRWLAKQSFLRAAVLLAGAGNFVSNGLALVIIVLARGQGASATLIGAVFAIFAAGGLLGSIAAPALQRRLSAPHAVIGYLVIYALLVPILAIASPLELGLLFGAMLFGAPTLNAIFGAYEVALVPDRLLGRGRIGQRRRNRRRRPPLASNRRLPPLLDRRNPHGCRLRGDQRRHGTARHRQPRNPARSRPHGSHRGAHGRPLTLA